MKVLFAISTEKGANQIIDFYKSKLGQEIKFNYEKFIRDEIKRTRRFDARIQCNKISC